MASNTSSHDPYTKLRLAIIVVFSVLATSLLSLLMGLELGEREGRFFQAMQSIKRLLIPPVNETQPAQLRFNEFGQLAYFHDKIEVPPPDITERTVIAFVFGQSNSANHGGEKYFSKTNQVYNYWNGKFYKAADPLLGATGSLGNVWTNVGNKLIEEGLADKVVLIAAGVGASSITDWQNNGRLNGMLSERIKEAKASSLAINYFLWHQGENDNALDPRLYRAGLDQVIDLTKQYFPASQFYVAQASRCRTAPPSMKIQEAQKDVTQRENVFLGPNTDEIDLDDRYDECHFSGRGLERHANGWIQALKHSFKSPTKINHS